MVQVFFRKTVHQINFEGLIVVYQKEQKDYSLF